MNQFVQLTFDGRLFSPEAIQKAAYRGMSSLTVDIEMNGEGQMLCVLSPNVGVSDEGFAYSVQEFKKNVLDYQLRLKISLETEPVRNLILGLAFSRTGLQGSE